MLWFRVKKLWHSANLPDYISKTTKVCQTSRSRERLQFGMHQALSLRPRFGESLRIEEQQRIGEHWRICTPGGFDECLRVSEHPESDALQRIGVNIGTVCLLTCVKPPPYVTHLKIADAILIGPHAWTLKILLVFIRRMDIMRTHWVDHLIWLLLSLQLSGLSLTGSITFIRLSSSACGFILQPVGHLHIIVHEGKLWFLLVRFLCIRFLRMTYLLIRRDIRQN